MNFFSVKVEINKSRLQLINLDGSKALKTGLFAI